MKIIDYRKKRSGPAGRQAGMTYVELIVVLSIFAVMLSIALFNYKKFQGKVDIKSLANDVALKLVEAQRASFTGKFLAGFGANKPSYGMYFNTADNKKFIYFADLNNSGLCDNSGTSCTAGSYSIAGEVQDVITITRNNTISSIKVFGTGGSCVAGAPVTNMTVVFKRPSTTPIINTPAPGCATISYYAIAITSPAATQAVTSTIKLYPSGRVQIN